MTLPNTLNNCNLQTAAKSLLPLSFLSKAGSREIQGSTTGTTTTSDKWEYAPSAGQTVYLTHCNMMIWDNSAWNDAAQFGDYASALTDGMDFRVDYGGAVSYSIYKVDSSAVYLTQTGLLYGRFTNKCNREFLNGSFTADDRAVVARFEFAGQNIVLKGDNSDKFYMGVRQSLAVPAIEVIWSTVGGWLL